MNTVARLTVVFLSVATAVSPSWGDPIVKVNCDKGQTLGKALKKADPGDTILVSGTCVERVTVTTDRITIDGQGSAVLDGGGGYLADFTGVLTIDGAKGVRLQGLTIRHGPGEGILALRGAAFTAEQTVSRDNGTTGIAVLQGSTAELRNCTMTGNQIGLDVFTGASAVLRDAVAIDQNLGDGVQINGHAVVEIRAANVTASGNGGIGILVGSGQLAIFGFPVTPASVLTTNDNGFAGIRLGGSVFTVYSAATVTASGNGVFGILSGGPSFLVTTPGSGSRFLIENNAVGMRVLNGAGMNFGLGRTADGDRERRRRPAGGCKRHADSCLRSGAALRHHGQRHRRGPRVREPGHLQQRADRDARHRRNEPLPRRGQARVPVACDADGTSMVSRAARTMSRRRSGWTSRKPRPR